MKKVAVLGFGFMGKTHVQNILMNKDLQLVAIVDKNPEAITKDLSSVEGNLTTGNFDYQRIKKIKRYTSFDNCLKSEQLDAVHICVHTDLHYEMVKKALNHGLHVLVEKPFCLDIKQGEELINLAKDNGLLLMVAHVVRFMPPYQQLKDWVKWEAFGKLKFLSLSRFSGIPQWGQWKEKQIEFGSSGGALFDLLIHDIDYANYLIGSLPDKNQSFVLPGKLSTHDYVNAIWNFPQNKLTLKIEGGNIFHTNFPFHCGYTAQFEMVSVYYSSLKPGSILVSDEKETKEISTSELSEGYFSQQNYFYNCIRNKQGPIECTIESSLESIRICYQLLKKEKKNITNLK